MVESTSSGSSSDTNEPVCAQLLTQLNTAYQHLAPDAQALVSIANYSVFSRIFWTVYKTELKIKTFKTLLRLDIFMTFYDSFSSGETIFKILFICPKCFNASCAHYYICVYYA